MRSSLYAIILTMVVSTFAMAQGLPIGVSQSMIDEIRRMPVAQQRTLAAQYGIDLSQQPNGVYFVRLLTNGQVATKRVVVNK